MNLNAEQYAKRVLQRSQVERDYEWRKWIRHIPHIQFKSDWEVQIIPPFGGAVVRFCVKHISFESRVSVYLDCYDELGSFGEPYWEVYPHGNDLYRTEMSDTKGLIQAITESLEEQRKRGETP